MATDFAVLQYLLGAPPGNSFWASCINLDKLKIEFLIGDRHCDRVIFPAPPSRCVKNPKRLKKRFLEEVRSRKSSLTATDTLFVVLVGHGREDGGFCIGSVNSDVVLLKHNLELALEGFEGTTIVISTACFSGQWDSERWTLLAGAEKDKESVSISKSASGHCRGGIFVTSLMAAQAEKYGVLAPSCGPLPFLDHRSLLVHLVRSWRG